MKNSFISSAKFIFFLIASLPLSAQTVTLNSGRTTVQACSDNVRSLDIIAAGPIIRPSAIFGLYRNGAQFDTSAYGIRVVSATIGSSSTAVLDSIRYTNKAEHVLTIDDTLSAGDTVHIQYVLHPNCGTIPQSQASATANIIEKVSIGGVTCVDTPEFKYPYLLAGIGATGQISTTLAYSPQSTYDLLCRYVNTGSAIFSGYLSITWFDTCSVFFKDTVNLTSIGVFDGFGNLIDSSLYSFSQLPSAFTFDGIGNHLAPVPVNGYIEIAIHALARPPAGLNCVSSNGCNRRMNAKWGCDAAHNCISAAQLQFSFIPDIEPKIMSLTRLSPKDVSNLLGYWDNSCTSEETQWQFVLSNRSIQVLGHADTARNVQVDLTRVFGGTTGMQTRIRKNSIRVTRADSTQAFTYVLPHFTYPSPAPVENPAFMPDFTPGCIPLDSGDMYLSAAYIYFGNVAVTDTYVISFKTVRCCPHVDSVFKNRDHYEYTFNHWNLNGRGTLGCSNFEFSQMAGDTMFHGERTYASALNSKGGISKQFGEDYTSADLILNQTHQQYNVGIRDGDTSSACSPDVDNIITNFEFPIRLMADADFQLCTDSPTQFPRGVLALVFNLEPNLVCGATAPVISNGGVNWPASNYYNATAPSFDTDPYTRGYALFNLDSLRSVLSATHPNPTASDFSAFFFGSEITFNVKGCCPMNEAFPSPKARIRTYFTANPKGSCSDCFIPLNQEVFTYVLFCPGCVTPGVISQHLSVERNTFGFQDADNDGIMDTIGGVPLSAGDSSYAHFSSVKRSSSLVGDVIHLRSSAFFSDDGGSTAEPGYTYDEWQNCDTLHPSRKFSDLYLQLSVGSGAEVGLSEFAAFGSQSIRLIVKRGAVLDTAYGNLMSGFPHAQGTNSQLVYHFSDSALGSFVPGEEYFVDAYLKICKNPDKRKDLLITHYLMLTYGVPESAVTNVGICNYNLYSSLTDAGKSNKDFPGQPCASSPYVIGSVLSDARYFLCEPRAAIHSVFAIVEKERVERWWNTADCNRRLAIKRILQVEDNGLLNPFKYEFRPIPGDVNLDVYALNGHGPHLSSDPTQPVSYLLKVPHSYRAHMEYLYTAAPSYSGSLINQYYVTTLPFDSSVRNLNPAFFSTTDSLSVPASPPYPTFGYKGGGVIYPNTSTMAYWPIYENHPITLGFSPPFDVSTPVWSSSNMHTNFHSSAPSLSARPALALGDEYFEQGLIVNLLPICTDTVQDYKIKGTDVEQIYPSLSSYCTSQDTVFVGDTIRDPILHGPRITIQSNLDNVKMDGDDFSYDLHIRAVDPQSGQALAANSTFYVQLSVPVPCDSTSLILPTNVLGTSVDLVGIRDLDANAFLSPTLITDSIHCFLNFEMRVVDKTSDQYRFVFRFKDCMPPQLLHIPIYYGWSCDDDYPKLMEPRPATLTLRNAFANKCMAGSEMIQQDATIAPPQASVPQILASPPTAFGCLDTASRTYRVGLANSGAGGLGDMIVNVGPISPGFAVYGCRLQSGPWSFSVPNSKITMSGAMASIDLREYTDFDSTDHFGTDGVTASDSMVFFSFLLKPAPCSYELPPVELRWHYSKYCNRVTEPEIVPQDTTAALFAAVAAPSGCKPYVTGTDSMVCNGQNLVLHAHGGTSYLWSTGAETDSIAITPFASETYSVSVIQSGCTTVVTDSINVPDGIGLAFVDSNYDCDGGALTIIANASGGVPPFSYAWSTGAATSSIAHVPFGTYGVTVTDAHGCSVSGNAARSKEQIRMFISGYQSCSIYSGTGGEGATSSELDTTKPCPQVCANGWSRISVVRSASGTRDSLAVVGGIASFNPGYSDADHSVYDIQWNDAPGQGYVKAIETSTNGCTLVKSSCITILPRPIARAWVVGAGGSEPIDLCTMREVAFENNSFVPSSGTNAQYGEIVHSSWDFGDGTGSSLDNPTHAYAQSGTYYAVLTVSTSCNCTSSDTIELNVQYSKEQLVIECPSTVCEGQTKTYVVSPCQVTWQCIGGTILYSTFDSVQIRWDAPPANGIGYILATPYSCSACIAPATVAIPIIPTNAPLTGPSKICVRNKTYYEMPVWPGTDYQWSFLSNTADAHIIDGEHSNRVLIVADSAGTFRIQCAYYNSIARCGNKKVLDVGVSHHDSIIVAPAPFCAGTSLTLSMESHQHTEFQIIRPDVSIDTLPDVGTYAHFTPTMPGEYIITATSANVCIDEPRILSVVPSLADSPGVSGPSEACRNTPITFNAIQPASAGTHYQWSVRSANGHLVGNAFGNSAVAVFSGSDSIAYVYLKTVLDSPSAVCLTSSIDTFAVRLLHANPRFYSPDTVCANSYSGDFAAVSGNEDSYHWAFDPPNLASCQAGEEQMPNPHVFFNNVSVPTFVAVSLEVHRCGEVVKDTMQVLVLPNPTISVDTPSSAICSGNSKHFTASLHSIAASVSYEWSFSDGTTANTAVPSVDHTFNTDGTHWVRVSASLISPRCSFNVHSPNLFITVRKQPEVIVDNSSGNPPCNSNAVSCNLTASATPSACCSGSFVWNYLGTAVGTGTSYTATALGLYTASVTDAYGCTASGYINVYKHCDTAGVCPGVIFNGEHVSVDCDDYIEAETHYSIPSGYTFNRAEWSMGIRPPGSSAYFVSTGGSAGSYANCLAHADKPGLYTLIHKVILNGPTGEVGCIDFLDVLVPLVQRYEATWECGDSSYTLVLRDNSLLAGDAVSGYQWSLNGIVNHGAAADFPNLLPGETYTIQFTIFKSDVAGGSCTQQVTVTAPYFPDAHFNYVTAPLSPGMNRPQFCEDFSITLQPVQPYNPSWTYLWRTGDPNPPDSIYYYDPSKEYGIPIIDPVSIKLLVFDDYGCQTEAIKTVNQVIQNNLTGSIGEWILGQPNALNQPENAAYLCEQEHYNFFYEFDDVSAAPTHWKWVSAPDLSITVGTSATYLTSIEGRYFCSVSDDNGCKYMSRSPGNLVALQMPSVSIRGKNAYCGNESGAMLHAVMPQGTTINHWTLDGANVSNTTPDYYLDFSGISTGAHTMSVNYSYSFANTGSVPVVCTSESDDFTFVVNELPTPEITIPPTPPVNCELFQVQLDGHTSGPTNYNWSTGESAESIIVHWGGTFSLSVTSDEGCVGSTQITIPDDPEIGLQYVPTGCYEPCADLLKAGLTLSGPPRPPYFTHWSWLVDGSKMYDGSNSAVPPISILSDPENCHRYQLELYSDVDGRGNPLLCKKTSPPLTVCEAPCPECRVVLSDSMSNCSTDSGSTFGFLFTAYNPDPTTYSYSLQAIYDGTAFGTISSYPANIHSGSNYITANLLLSDTLPDLGHLIILMEVDSGDFHCVTSVELDYDCSDPIFFKMDHQNSAPDAGLAKRNSSFFAMPNPANSYVDISYRFASEDASSSKAVSIMDPMGKTVWSERIANSFGLQRISTSSLSEGIYWIEWTEDGQVRASQKIAITH